MLTVRDLTEIPYLKTRVRAGGNGLDRTITWAHSCELSDPWGWMEKGDLLMTVGMGIPEDRASQVEYVEKLAEVEVSGLAIGEDMLAPPITDEMIARADQLALPLLITGFEVPFIQLSRAVGAANRSAAQDQMIQAARVYDRVREVMAHSPDAPGLFRHLGDEIECDLWICLNETGDVAFSGSKPLPEPILAALVDEIAGHDESAIPGMSRVEVGDRVALVVPVPVQRPVSLVAVSRSRELPSYATLQHVAAIAALEFERLISAREELRRLGSETFAALLDRRLSPESAGPSLRRHQLGGGPMVVVASGSRGDTSRSIHHSLAERGLPHMLLHREPWLYCLTSNRDPALAEVLEVFGELKLTIGVSDQLSDLGSLSEAVRESHRAYEVAESERQPVARYSDSTVGFHSLSEARAIVDRVLGPLIEYDRAHGSALVESLSVFLRQNRSWQAAASELNVHKQTLVYRMRRVEELTGRKLRDTDGIAEFWLAVSAMKTLDTS
ncbi:MAG: PucR family transcriptional regulator ligand-binding domain-containing protein [Actinomycetota bacterium]|nr:PucR family transcriptional regulator ligand-binding domain-containing protein [Actinomycetota bacterium]